ncbi:MAG: class I SAM-dependent methyltransferase [Chthoniobacterales bacterium]
MRLSRKIEKLTSGEAWCSAVDAYYRFSRSLTIAQLLKGLDPSEFRRLRAKYGVAGETKAWPKYVDERRWLKLAIEQAQELCLDRRKPSRILDLGSGAGYFLYVCQHLGHDGLGLDLDWPPLYHETFKLLGLQRVIWHIDPFEPLPDLTKSFHLVTAFAICFNAHETDHVWGPQEWGFFLDDLEKNVLEPGGEVFLSFNPESYGHYTSELREFFLDRGARIERQKVWLKAKQ